MKATKEELLLKAKKRAREAFVVFEHREGSKLVDIKEIPSIIGSLGYNPTPVLLQEMQQQLLGQLPDDHSYIPLESFEDVAAKFIVEHEEAVVRDNYHTLLRAFRAFDPDRQGYIETDRFKEIICSKGDSFSQEECNSMIAFAADDLGRICYEEYAFKLATDGRSI